MKVNIACHATILSRFVPLIAVFLNPAERSPEPPTQNQPQGSSHNLESPHVISSIAHVDGGKRKGGDYHVSINMPRVMS